MSKKDFQNFVNFGTKNFEFNDFKEQKSYILYK